MLSIDLHIGDIVLENGWDVDLLDTYVRTIVESSILRIFERCSELSG